MRRTKHQNAHKSKYSRDKAPRRAAQTGQTYEEKCKEDYEHTMQKMRNYYGTRPGVKRKKK